MRYNIYMDEILRRLTEIEAHVGVLNDEYGQVAVRLAVLEMQMAEISWMTRLVLGAIVLSLIGSVYGIIARGKNNRNKV